MFAILENASVLVCSACWWTLAQNSPGLQLKAKSTSLTVRSIFFRGEGFEDLPVKFYKVFTTDVQNMIFQSLKICPNLSELSRKVQNEQMWKKDITQTNAKSLLQGLRLQSFSKKRPPSCFIKNTYFSCSHKEIQQILDWTFLKITMWNMIFGG